MARIKLGPMVTNISGSIGGLTIQRNRFGITMRRKPLPPTSSTSAQYNVRQKIITIQKAWQDLTDAKRLQWDRFLDFSGQSINADRSVKLSGHALYLKYQLFRLLAGFSLLIDLTYVPMPAVPVISQVLLSTGVLRLYLASAVDSTKYFFLFFITTPRNENQAFSNRGLRYMKVTIADNTFYDLYPSYIEAFGILPGVEHRVHTRIQWFSVLSPVFTGISTGVYWAEE